MHGFMGLRHLSAAHEMCGTWDALQAEIDGMSEREMFSRGAGPAAKKSLLEKEIAEHLFASVILFQASMESILNMTSGMDEQVEQAVNRNDSFANQWRAALRNVGEDTEAFDRYRNDIYDDYRNPLVHLGDDEDVRKVNAIEFKQVYCGIRAGWWAYDALLHGIGESDGDAQGAWNHFCELVGLQKDLYPDDELVADSAD